MNNAKTYWKDTLLVGVPQIDKQHKKLVEVMDQLMVACMMGKGRELLRDTLNYVLSYTKEHFRDEEELQNRYSYPGIKAHKQIHSRFISDVTVLVQEFEQAGPSVALISKLNKELAGWLINHISTEDKKVGAHIASVA